LDQEDSVLNFRVAVVETKDIRARDGGAVDSEARVEVYRRGCHGGEGR